MDIRDATLADAGRILAIYSYYVENTAINFDYETPTLGEFTAGIAQTLERYPYLVVEEEGEILGFAYAAPFNHRDAYSRCCELSIYLDHGKRRRGLGRALYTELERRLAQMGFLNLYACIAYPPVEDEYLTKDSELFHARLGFSKVGEFHSCGYKFGRWYDMIWMEKLVGEHSADGASAP